MKFNLMIQVIRRSVLSRALSNNATGGTGPTQSAQKPSSATGSGGVNAAAVTGLGPKVMTVPNSEVGPGASKTSSYKNPEYYCYNPFSFAQAEVEMIKFRLPQPSNKSSK